MLHKSLSALALSAASLAALPAAVLAQDNGGAVSAGLVQNYDPAPAMWRLSDDDTTIYMLGTVHLLPDGFRWRNEQLDAIVDEVDMLVLESSEEDAEASLAHIGPKFGGLVRERTPTSRQLSPAARGNWRRLVEMSGQPFDAVDQMPLMVALMGFGMMGTDMGPSTRENGVETILEAEFAESGRPISSVEDNGRVMMSIYRISDDLILSDLEQDLIYWDGRNADAFFGAVPESEDITDWELEHAWARGDVQDVTEFGIQDAKLAIAFHNALLASRNRRWAAWLDERLDSPGTILLAVGAAHFEGEDSVLAMLQERGLEAVRINGKAE